MEGALMNLAVTGQQKAKEAPRKVRASPGKGRTLETVPATPYNAGLFAYQFGSANPFCVKTERVSFIQFLSGNNDAYLRSRGR